MPRSAGPFTVEHLIPVTLNTGSGLRYCITPVTPYQQNCSLLICDSTQQAVLVDPGGELDKLLDEVQRQQVTLQAIWLTHGHLDHIGGVNELANRLQLPIIGPHRDDAFWIEGLPEQCRMMGFPRAEPFSPDRWLEDGDHLQLGSLQFEVVHCPGHTPGHVVFYHRPSRLALVGDVLFNGSIGRTDFPKGDYDTLIHSITKKLWPLGDEVTFIPGHGPCSSFGAERRSNPYVSDAALRTYSR